MFRVYPVEGRLIRDPVTGRLVTEKGMKVKADDPFWIRALRDGDVTKAPPKQEKGGE